jgi:L-fuculose-phosphate aldolase
MNESQLREAICEVGRRMYARGLVAATDGNISVLLEPGVYLCTPSGVSKGFMHPADLLLADAEGNRLAGSGKVTSEFFTHLAAYEERPDIAAVCHAHPPVATGFTLAGKSLSECVLPEVVMTIGGIPTTPYATPGTREGNEVVRDLIRQCDAVMLDRHGAVTVGPDLFDAYFKLEKLEHAAESLLVAHQLGGPALLDAEDVRKLGLAREAYGAKGKAYPCGGGA